MKRYVIAALLATAASSPAKEGLTREEIQAAIAAAPKDQLGDSIRVADRQYFYSSFSRDLQDRYIWLFDRFPITQNFAIPVASQPLPLRPVSDIYKSR